jgi:hypothetical protein
MSEVRQGIVGVIPHITSFTSLLATSAVFNLAVEVTAVQEHITSWP